MLHLVKKTHFQHCERRVGTEEQKSKRKEIFNHRLSLNIMVTKCPLQHAVQSVMRPLVHFEERALTVGISFSISFCPFFLISLFRFTQNNLTFDPHDRIITFL